MIIASDIRYIYYFTLLSIVAIFTCSSAMTDIYIVPKWLSTLGLLAVIGIIEGLLLLLNKPSKMNVPLLFTMVALTCLSQAIYVIMQVLGIIQRCSQDTMGSFDNPAGLVACLCACVPYCFYLSNKTHNVILKFLVAIIVAVIIIALFISESRTGILAGFLFPFTWLAFCRIKKGRIKLLVLSVGLIFLSVMYIVKKDSADGRLFIYNCALEMTKERPILGYGMNGVQAHYMDFQAKWLSEHPNSRFAYLADNVNTVFNEYLTIVICFGLVGIVVLCLYICLMIHCYRKTPSKETKCALMSLIVIGILCCFSYPFTYPFTWIVLVLNSYILIHRAYPLTMVNKVRYPVAILLLIISSFVGYGVLKRTQAEQEWRQVSHTVLLEKNKDVLSCYNSLMGTLGNEPYFLYNYAAELYIAEHYDKALLIAQRCRSLWADYDLEILLGEIYFKLYNYKESENHFRLASQMCPVRFVPLYRLFCLYRKMGLVNRAQMIGEKIINKPIKVYSHKVDYIINKVKLDMAK